MRPGILSRAFASRGTAHRTSAGAARTPREIEEIERAARIARRGLDAALSRCTEGVTTGSIDHEVEEIILRLGAAPLFKGYAQGDSPAFPGCSCISINDEVVHGIPSESRRLAAGDLVTIDVGVRLDGWCADAASSVVVDGSGAGARHSRSESEAGLRLASPDSRHLAHENLVMRTRAVLEAAIRMIEPGARWSDIAGELEAMAHDSGCGIVTEYVGHGIGRELHESPRVPAYRTGFTGEDFVLVEGMVLAIEPILTLGRAGIGGDAPGCLQSACSEFPAWRMPVRILADGWTVVTADGSSACHEEHMVAVVRDGCRVLTA